jgi:CDP-diacylglycerol---glycerol-3-phosphate 3-phosphatidyltransferase
MSVSALPEVPKTHPRILNIPNLLTLGRLVLAVVLFILLSQHDWMFTSFLVFIVAASTDWLDGYLARRRGETTTLGRVLDPFVDKVVVIGAFIFLLGEGDETGLAPWMVTVVVARELLVTGLRSFLEGESVAFGADWMGKIKMVLQCVAISSILFYLGVAKGMTYFFNEWSGFVLEWSEKLKDITLWAAIVVTAISGVAYSWRAAVLIRDRNLG